MADRLDYFFRQRVTEAELDLGFTLLENADRNFAKDIGLFGVISGAVVQETAPATPFEVELTGPASAYDQEGRRTSFGTSQFVDVSVDTDGTPTTVVNVGNEKIVSVYLKFERDLSDPRTDGNSVQVFFQRDEGFRIVVRQGGEAPAGTAVPPALQPDELLLADITRTFGQTQITNPSILPRPDIPGPPGRRQNFIFVDADGVGIDVSNFNVLAPLTLDVQSAFDEVDDELDVHFQGTARRHSAPDIDANPAFGSPTDLVGGTVEAQLQELIDHHNNHLNDTSNAHDAGSLTYFGASGAPSFLPPTYSAPFNQMDAALDFLLGEVNKRVAKSGDTISGALTVTSAVEVGTGLDVGFTTSTPLNDTLRVGDTNFSLQLAGDSILNWDTGVDRFLYDRSANALFMQIAGASEVRINSFGLNVQNGLYVGNTVTNPTDNGIICEGGLTVGANIAPLNDAIRIGVADFFLQWNGADPIIQFDDAGGLDRLFFDRSANAYLFQINSVTEMRLNTLGLNITNGLYVGNSSTSPTDNGIVCEGGLTVGTTTAPIADQIIIGVADFKLIWNGVDPSIQFDDAGGNDRILFDRSSNEFCFDINSVNEMRLNASGLEITNGLLVGFNATPTNDAVLVADANFGLVGGTIPELRFDSEDRIRYDRADNRMIFTAGGADVLALRARSLSGVEFFNQQRSTTVSFMDDTTSGTFMRNSLGLSGSNVNGTLSVSRNSNAGVPNIRASYNGGFSAGGIAMDVGSVGFVDVRRPEMRLQPYSVSGAATLPDLSVSSGAMFNAADFSPDRLYYHNGSSWVQIG